MGLNYTLLTMKKIVQNIKITAKTKLILIQRLTRFQNLVFEVIDDQQKTDLLLLHSSLYLYSFCTVIFSFLFFGTDLSLLIIEVEGKNVSRKSEKRRRIRALQKSVQDYGIVRLRKVERQNAVVGKPPTSIIGSKIIEK